MGACVIAQEDGMVIEGKRTGSDLPLKGGVIHTFGDHRIAMAFSIAALIAEGETVIDDDLCVSVSYPGFYSDLSAL